MAIQHALRSLRASPRFTVAAVVTLALGIGANAAIFSVVDRMVLHPFPAIDHPDRVVWLFETGGKVDLDRDGVVPANYVDWRAQSHTLSAFAALRLAEVTLTGGGEPERVSGQATDAGWFTVMGIKPLLGRFFEAGEERAAVAVISRGLWQRRFGGDPDIVGRSVEINGRATTVVGVLPPDFIFPSAPDIIVPLALEPRVWASRNEPAFAALARLAPGATLDEARAELDVIAARLEKEHPDTNTDLRVRPLPIGQVFNRTGAMLALLAGVGFLLLIACGNVANLLLARGAARRRELAVKQALGAGRGRIVGQLLVETLVIAVAGAGLGLLLAVAGVDLLVASMPDSMLERSPIFRMVSVNGEVLAFAAGLTVACTVIAGLIPALRSAQVDLVSSLKDGTATAGGGRRRLMGALVVVQLALAMLLLSGAGLMMRSFQELRGRPTGFRAEGVYTLRLPLETRHPEAADRVRFVDQVLERLAGLPGAAGAAATDSIPSTENAAFPFSVVGQPAPSRDEMPVAHGHGVTPDFFRVLELPVRGRTFTRADAGRPVVIVSQSIEHRLFHDRDPIGQRLDLGGTVHEIVGVAGDVPSPNPRSNALGTLYFPFGGETGIAILTLRAADPLAFGALARAAVHELDPRQVIEAPRLLEQVLAERRARDRMAVWIVGVTSSIAMLLAALGIYGLVSYSVGQRTRELGIRVALGARAPALLATILRQVLLLVAAGMVLGLALAVPLGRALRSAFYLPGSVALPFAAVALVFAAVAAVAGLLPARRALRVDPMIALRSDT